MSIRYACEGCGASLKIEEKLAGTEGHCPKCHASFTVPQPNDATDRDTAELELGRETVVADAAAADSSQAETASAAKGAKRRSLKKAAAHSSGGSAADVAGVAVAANDGSASDEDLAASFLSDDPPPPPVETPRDQPIRYTCTECGSQLKIKVELAGTKGRCPKCQTRFIVPTPEAPGAEATAPSADAEPKDDPADAPRELYSSRGRSAASSQSRPGSASDIATSFLKHNARVDSEAKSTAEPPPRPEDRDKIDWAATAGYFARTALPAIAAIVVVCAGFYWLSSMVFKGSPERPPLGYVEGTVTLDDKPLAGALITFRPTMDEVDGVKTAESVGRTDKDGFYTLNYVQDVDGAAVGEHRVEINATDPETGAELLDPIHHAKSTRLAKVESGSNTFDFKLESSQK